MVNPESRLFCRLDGLTAPTREQQRLLALAELGLLEVESVPIFEEATQMAAHFLDASICILGLMDRDRQWFKSAVGLSRIGLMNELATSRQIPRSESFCTHVVDSGQVLALEDALAHPAFTNSFLVQRYGIRSYLGVPLLSSTGHCLGTLAIMDLQPRLFSTKEIEFLELTARWSISEYERNHLMKAKEMEQLVAYNPPPPASTQASANQVKVELLAQLTQELRTPLTSVMGMASVLTREIYGPLTNKQKEYLDIVHNSGQYLLSLVNEILELAEFNEKSQTLSLASVDIEMLCQQAINTLSQAASRREQQIRLTVEPGPRIWLLDREKIRQMLYHLIFSVIQASTAGSTVRIHVSRKGTNLNLAIWVSHPWLGEGLPYAELQSSQAMVSAGSFKLESVLQGDITDELTEAKQAGAATSAIAAPPEPTKEPQENLRKNLGLLLSRQLAEMHGGQISIQGSPESGYRYVISLPQVAMMEAM